MRQKWKRPLALLLSVAMMFSMSGTPAYAADVETGASAVCPHHVHDATCGYSEGSPCTFDAADCELCNPTDSGEPEAPAECTCETLCTEDSVDPDCPVCGAEGADLADCTGAAPALLAKIAQLSKLVVGGTTVVENSQTTENTSGQGWSYDVDSNTLTLDNATINGTDTIGHVGAGIYAEGDLTIVLEGSSTVKGVQDPNGDSQSIRVQGNLTIQGGGSLTAQGADTSNGSSYGIFVIGSFTQQSGSVTASGGNINGNYTSTGLYVYGGTVTVQGGTLKATGGATDSGSYGISMSSSSSVTVGSAAVTATGGTGNYSYGLYVNPSPPSVSPSVTLSGSGSLTARSGTATNRAGGIYFQNPFGSAGSVTVGENSTLLTNSVILYDNSFEAKPLAPTGNGSWLIYGQSDQPSAVGGTYTLKEDFTIENGNTFTIPAGSTLTVPQGKTLTVNGTLTNQGTLSIAAESCLTGSGSLEGDGSFTAVAVTGIEVPDDVTCADYEKKVVLAGPTVLGHAFTADGWTLTFTKGEVTLDGCSYTVTASKEGSESIEKTFTAQHSFGEDGKCPCGASRPTQDAEGCYQVADAFQLFWFAGLVNGTLTDGTEQNTSASAVLTADIDLSGETWTPIGRESTPYIGTFDGQGYTISGMTIENAESYSGLFGNVTGTVKNFTVTGSITITGDETVARVGGAVGSLGTASAGGTVSGVTSGVDITVSAGNDHIGGVVGSMPENSSPTVENCIYTGKITVTVAAGSVAGIVGYIRTGTIQNCANQGSISVDVGGTGSVGGILGYCNNGGIYIRNCYNTGAISADGTDNVGAIVGQNKGTQATVSNCYYLTGSANQGQGQLTTDAAGTVVKTADEFASGEVTYLLNGSTSEDLTWYQNLGDDGDQYPVLDSSHGVVYQVENGYSNQNGHVFDDNGFCTEPDCGMYQPAAWNEAKGCYEISNAGQLFWFAALVNGDKTHAEFEKQNLSAGAVLTADITIPSDESGTYNWTPIGNYSANGSLRYNGTFDGAGHTISGLKIDNAQMHFQGFVGYLDDDGTILNLTMDETCSVIGIGSVGGVCSYNYGTITNCSNSGTVIGGSSVGGVCGVSYGTITNCSNTGAVTENNDQGGGVCGYVYNGTVQNCSNSGTVIGGRTVGGVCGYVKNGAIIQNCSNTGAVTGKVSVGGVCGDNDGNITNCYNTGTVIGKFYVGGVIGEASNNGTVQNCYYLDTSHNTGIGSGRFEVTAKTAQQFGSGEVCYLLNGSTSEGDLVWYQNLDNGQRVDSCPVLDNTHGTVYCIEADPVFYSNDPEGEPVQIIRVDIIWGALSYTYQEATWNANTHTYDGAGWTVDDEAGNAITVANNGTLPVTVSYAYQAVENGISGSFADGDDKPVSGPVALPAWDSTTVWLLLEGKPERALDQATIGGVTVTIGGE